MLEPLHIHCARLAMQPHNLLPNPATPLRGSFPIKSPREAFHCSARPNLETPPSPHQMGPSSSLPSRLQPALAANPGPQAAPSLLPARSFREGFRTCNVVLVPPIDLSALLLTASVVLSCDRPFHGCDVFLETLSPFSSTRVRVQSFLFAHITSVHLCCCRRPCGLGTSNCRQLWLA